MTVHLIAGRPMTRTVPYLFTGRYIALPETPRTDPGFAAMLVQAGRRRCFAMPAGVHSRMRLISKPVPTGSADFIAHP